MGQYFNQDLEGVAISIINCWGKKISRIKIRVVSKKEFELIKLIFGKF